MATRLYTTAGHQELDVPLALLREVDDFGIKTLELVRPPGRFWGGRRPTGALRNAFDASSVKQSGTLAEMLADSDGNETTMGLSRRAQGQLFSWYLLCEDPQRRLESRLVSTLAHQASLVRHVLDTASLKSVLIADEVGLGKTVEAGLIIKELLETNAGLRVLYLAPAGLTRNVYRELTRLDLPFRLWVTGIDNNARLTDQMVLASIHRAVHPAHLDTFVASGPWDLLIVDECHHLSDWQKDGGKPTRKYRLVDALRARLAGDARLILMSGTPHQGHPNRFDNLLKLLQRGNEPRAALAGRVIYRTKDDVTDWEGRPLFPRRLVREPLVLDLGAEHRKWLEEIHRTFELTRSPEGITPEIGQARRRALDWRCGQALQWATSSIEAGLGFLVRQAIRAGWAAAEPALREAVAALRPYRRGPANEDIDELFRRISKEIGRQRTDGDLEDIEAECEGAEDERDSSWQPDRARLTNALTHGVNLLKTHGDARWEHLRTHVLDSVANEKVVLFAQPIETVTSLAAYLARIDKRPPAMIIGGQKPEERAEQVQQFWRSDGPRFLVSSRAGGEGFNLQNAHILVHVDVPWNPMELEQRVGRVHRFGSRRTIQVHTMVVANSREVDMYDLARAKLRNITRMLRQDNFEDLFARVMALVPPEELADVLVREPLGPLSDADQQALADLVTEGHRRWEQFNREFSAAQREIRAVSPGRATWRDVQRFARDHLGARPFTGASALRFGFVENEVVEQSEATEVLEIDGQLYACGDYSSPVVSPDGRSVRQLGLNIDRVADQLRSLGLTRAPTAAYVRWPNEHHDFDVPGAILAYGRVELSIEDSSYRETGLELSLHYVGPDGRRRPITRSQQEVLIRELLDAPLRREPELPAALVDAVRAADDALSGELRRPHDAVHRYALFPLAVFVLTRSP